MGCVVMCAISSVGEAGREGTCGRGRLLAGLVYFTVDAILLRDMGTLGRGRCFGTAAMFGLMSSFGVRKLEGGPTLAYVGLIGLGSLFLSGASASASA